MSATSLPTPLDRPWSGIPLPPVEERPPGMLAVEELQYLIWLTETVREGWGAVVDLGPWLGGSTCALAEGLRRGGRPGKVLALDRFEWRREYMEGAYPANLPDHASFRFLFDRFTKPHAERIEARAVDLRYLRWDGGPVEILFVDAAKDWGLANNLLAAFGPDLVPEKSLVVLQDYQYWSTFLLPLIFEGRPDLWELVHMTEEGYTATFRPRRRLDGPGGIEGRYGPASFPYAVAAPLLRRLADERTGRSRLNLLGSLLRFCVLEGRSEEVARLWQEIRDDPAAPLVLPSLEGVEDMTFQDLERGWELRAEGRFEEALAVARSGLARRPGEPYFRSLLAWSLASLGRWDEAQEELDGLLRDAPESGQGWLDRAKMHLERDRPEAARAAAERVRALAGSEENLPTAYFEVEALLAERAGDLAGCLRTLARIVERRPYEARPRLWRSWVLRRTGRTEEALAEVREAVRLDPEDLEARQELLAQESARGH